MFCISIELTGGWPSFFFCMISMARAVPLFVMMFGDLSVVDGWQGAADCYDFLGGGGDWRTPERA